jgi:cytochrome c biogenesis protein ResB
MRLALATMLVGALLAVPGTFWSGEAGAKFFSGAFGAWSVPAARAVGLLDTYRSPPFLLVLAVLALNVSLCTWRRLRARGAAGRTGAALLDAALHVALVAILAGGAGRALFGFTGTGYLFVGEETREVYDWGRGADAPLGFGLVARERVEEFYPLRVKVGVSRAADGAKLALLEVREGAAPALLPGGDLALSFQGLDDRRALLRFGVAGRGLPASVELGAAESGAKVAPAGPYTLTLVAYRRVLRGVRSRVAVVDGGRTVREVWIASNDPLSYRGASVSATGWGRDDAGREYVGIQVTRDPAAPLFWAGCVLFSLAAPLLLVARSRRRGGPAAPAAGA